MIAVPITKKLSWRNPPFVTLAIILVNVFVFFVIQAQDDNFAIQSFRFYFESGLDDIEIPIYIEYLEKNRPDTWQQVKKADVDKDMSARARVYRDLNFDKDFLEQVRNEHIGPHDILEKDRYQSLRQEFENLQKEIVSLEYGFRPANHRPATWFTTMFLHGGFGHLFGNMIFLWMIGALIEYGCRRWLFLIIYLLGGLAATGFFWLLNSESMVPLIGASGAIAGIMGASTVLYGLKRVRVFFSLGFYFNYLKFPAIVLLPFWILNEVFQMASSPDSHVAYAAHLGGLMGGAAMAVLARMIPGLLDLEGFEQVREDPVKPLLERALEHMGKLEFTEARTLLLKADALQPENSAILKHLFTIDRQAPGSMEFHQTSKRLISTLCEHPQTHAEAYEIYKAYIGAARPPRLDAAMYLKLCRLFSEMGKLDDAQRLISVLVKNRPDIMELPSLLIKLAGQHARQGNQKAQQACLNCVCKQYPMSSEARLAREQMVP